MLKQINKKKRFGNKKKQRLRNRKNTNKKDLKPFDESKIIEIAKRESIYFNPNQAILTHPTLQVLIKIRNNQIVDIQTDLKENSRYQTVLNFINEVIQNPKYHIHGDFVFHLGDMSDHNLINEIVFSKNIYTQKSLMPDCYAMNNYKNIPNKKDNKIFFSKKPRGYFIGTSTGCYEPALNERLYYSDYSHQNKVLFDCVINQLCQIPEEKVKSVYPNYSKFVLNKRKTIEEQRSEYRYILDIDGNTCSWDRIVWIMKSNCICLKKKSDNINWYYPLFEKNKHYYEFNSPEELNNIIQNLNKLSIKNRILIRKNIKESKHFVSTYLNKRVHLLYFGKLLHFISEKFIEV